MTSEENLGCDYLVKEKNGNLRDFRKRFPIKTMKSLNLIMISLSENCMRFWNVTNLRNRRTESCKRCGSRRIIMKQRNYEDDL